MHVHQSANRSKVKQPCRVGDSQIHAAVTHGRAEVVVPIGAVQAIALIKIHDIRNFGEIVTRTRHIRRNVFNVDVVFARHCRRAPCAGGDDERC